MLLPSLVLLVIELFIEFDVPFTGDVGVPQQDLDKISCVLVRWVDFASKASLRPVANRACISCDVNMLEHEGSKTLLLRGVDIIRNGYALVPPEIASVVFFSRQLLSHSHPHLLIQLSTRS